MSIWLYITDAILKIYLEVTIIGEETKSVFDEKQKKCWSCSYFVGSREWKDGLFLGARYEVDKKGYCTKNKSPNRNGITLYDYWCSQYKRAPDVQAKLDAQKQEEERRRRENELKREEEQRKKEFQYDEPTSSKNNEYDDAIKSYRNVLKGLDGSLPPFHYYICLLSQVDHERTTLEQSIRSMGNDVRQQREELENTKEIKNKIPKYIFLITILTLFVFFLVGFMVIGSKSSNLPYDDESGHEYYNNVLMTFMILMCVDVGIGILGPIVFFILDKCGIYTKDKKYEAMKQGMDSMAAELKKKNELYRTLDHAYSKLLGGFINFIKKSMTSTDVKDEEESDKIMMDALGCLSDTVEKLKLPDELTYEVTDLDVSNMLNTLAAFMARATHKAR